MESTETLGILLQGKVFDWTRDIINEYHHNFPTAEIVLSTWENEPTQNISCKVIKNKLPFIPESHKNTVNYQIVGCQEGLKNLETDIIMKCRSDQFIHNKKIFELFQDSCPSDKIMICDFGTAIRKTDYRTSDFCQIGYRSILLDFWKDIPLYTGIPWEEAAKYLTKHYVLKIKNDNDPWELTLRKYFYVKSFHDDFHIEWEKLNNFDNYKNTYDISNTYNASIDN